MKVGVLALQGAFREHREVFASLGCEAFEVRSARDLVAADALVLPGGESTAMIHLLRTGDLLAPLRDRCQSGVPVLATCAGLILGAHEIVDGRADQIGLDFLDVTVRRNAYGRQQQSFEAPIDIGLPGGLFPGVFIRAPRIEKVGAEVEILGSYEGSPVLVRAGKVWASSFHPEISGDLRVHQAFIRAAREQGL